MNLLKQKRNIVFPGIKDFSATHPQWKYAKHQDLSLMDAFWFKPFVYLFFRWVVPSFFLLWAFIMYYVSYVFAFLLVVAFLFYSYKNIKEHKVIRDTNMYELFIKD